MRERLGQVCQLIADRCVSWRRDGNALFVLHEQRSTIVNNVWSINEPWMVLVDKKIAGYLSET